MKKVISVLLKTTVVVGAILGVILSHYNARGFMGGNSTFLYFTIQSNLWIALLDIVALAIMAHGGTSRRDNINGRTVYIPQPAGGQTIDVKEISRRIEGMCTVTKADVAAVLQALESVIGTALAQGDSVRLGTLGSFRVKMSAKAAESPEAVTTANITDV